MAANFTVSLFLPNTVNFKNDTSPTTPDKDKDAQLKASSRVSSSVDLPKRHSTSSLLVGYTPPVTPGLPHAEVEAFFSPGLEDQKRHLLRPGDPRSILRNDTHAEWGSSSVFNQPRSRAGPLPSSSIQDFAKAYEDARNQEEERKKRNRSVRNSDPGMSSTKPRASSGEREFDGRTWSIEPAIHGNGSLVNAIRDLTEQPDEERPETTWVGTLGFPTDSLPEHVRDDIKDDFVNHHQSSVVYCSDKDIDGHYAHYCKTILWPIFHYQVPDHPKSKAYADHSWEFYRNVNRAFADQIIPNYKRGDTIWVHDYHLLLVPKMLREKLGPDAKIGFFLHTAFPSSEVFRCLSTRKTLLEGMLGANLIGFQTEEYASHFLQTCSRLLTVETTAEGVQMEDRLINVIAQPIGITPSMFMTAREDDEVRDAVAALTEKYKGKAVIVARDKLDHVHGVRQKLLAYELFLNRNPQWRGKVVMIQVATSSSEQSELFTTVGDISTRIDAVHSTLAHQPLVFLRQDIGFAQYIAMLTIADVLMITSLRDGMNLTPHEFVACQDGKCGNKKYGPLILSEFTGTAAIMGDNPLYINPWDYSGQATAIKKALEMGLDERRKRWQNMHRVMEYRTGRYWAGHLSKELDRAYKEHHQRDPASVPRLSVTQVAEKYKDAESRLFIIDYEGTLAPHKTTSGIPLGSPSRIVDTLNELMADPKNIVYVMSGRKPEELGNHFRILPKVGLIAENGCFIREFGLTNDKWSHFVDFEEVANWKDNVRNILEYYMERLEGSYLEERHCSFLFRYDKAVDQDAGLRQAGECADQINGACGALNIQAVPIKQAILVEQKGFTKGTAATHIYNLYENSESSTPHPTFMLIAGDDREDEVIFRWANDLGKSGEIKDVFTVTVGNRNTVAQATLTQGSTGLLTLIQKLNKISSDMLPRDYFNLPMRKA